MTGARDDAGAGAQDSGRCAAAILLAWVFAWRHRRAGNDRAAPERIERLCLDRHDRAARSGSANAAAAPQRGCQGARGRHGQFHPRRLAAGWSRRPMSAIRACGDVICAMARDAAPTCWPSKRRSPSIAPTAGRASARSHVPTLVLAGEHEQVCPLEAHREMADGIPGAGSPSDRETPDISRRSKTRPPSAAISDDWLDVARSASPYLRHSHRQRSIHERHPTIHIEGREGGFATPRKADRARAAGRAARLSRSRADRPRRAASRCDGFDDIYTDIVDYIVRCTHRIWDERDVGLIYTHYTHNCVLYGTTGTIYNREDVVRDTIQRLVSFPERRGMAHAGDLERQRRGRLLHLAPRHRLRPAHAVRPLRPADRHAPSSSADDCRLHDPPNKIYREWVVADHDGDHQAARPRSERLRREDWPSRISTRACCSLDIGENRRMLGQYPPEAEADLSLAHNEIEAETLALAARGLQQAHVRQDQGRLCADRAVSRAADEGALWRRRRHASASGPGRLDPRCGLYAAAHLLEPLRGRRHQGRGALDHGGPPSRLRHPAGPRRADRRSACR